MGVRSWYGRFESSMILYDLSLLIQYCNRHILTWSYTMIKTNKAKTTLLCLSFSLVGACSTIPTSNLSPDSSSLHSSNVAIPNVPPAVSVTLDAKTTALLILDINVVICQPNPECVKTVPAISRLLSKARSSKVPVLYASTVNPAGPPPMLAPVAPQSGEPTVVARANKFTDTDLENLLKQRNVSTLVIVGSAANGAVMYSAFHANTKGFTVVVATDGISSPVLINTELAKYQLLNQPGFINSNNTPLADKRVTLSRSDLIDFR